MQFVKITVIFALKKELLSCFPLEAKTIKSIKVIYKSFLSHNLALSNRKLQDFKLFSFTNILYQLCKN